MKTTPAMFGHFEKCVKKWAGNFGLQNVHLGVVLQRRPGVEEEDEEESSAAWADYNMEDSIAIIGLDPEQLPGTRHVDIERWAFHEVWEVVLWPMRMMLDARGYSWREINTVVHDIIRRAETAQFGF